MDSTEYLQRSHPREGFEDSPDESAYKEPYKSQVRLNCLTSSRQLETGRLEYLTDLNDAGYKDIPEIPDAIAIKIKDDPLSCVIPVPMDTINHNGGFAKATVSIPHGSWVTGRVLRNTDGIDVGRDHIFLGQRLPNPTPGNTFLDRSEYLESRRKKGEVIEINGINWLFAVINGKEHTQHETNSVCNLYDITDPDATIETDIAEKRLYKASGLLQYTESSGQKVSGTAICRRDKKGNVDVIGYLVTEWQKDHRYPNEAPFIRVSCLPGDYQVNVVPTEYQGVVDLDSEQGRGEQTQNQQECRSWVSKNIGGFVLRSRLFKTR